MLMYTEHSVGISLNTIVVRGGGDIATGVIQKLHRASFNVLVLETAFPLTIRRTVALSSAVFEGRYSVEDMTAVLIASAEECAAQWEQGHIPVLVDPLAACLEYIKPCALVDAVIAKRNLGTCRSMAPVTVALGPGFSAPHDVDCVIETMRGHNLGRVITKGSALPNTGVPGLIGGKAAERVIHAPVAGCIRHIRSLGDEVKQGEPIFSIDATIVPAPLTGTLRGLIAEGLIVRKGLKCADIDPRPAAEIDCYSISDKARAVGGAVLEACLMKFREKEILPPSPTLQPQREGHARARHRYVCPKNVPVADITTESSIPPPAYAGCMNASDLGNHHSEENSMRINVTQNPAHIEKNAFTDVTLNINGQPRLVCIKSHWTLLYVLREILGFTGSKEACGEGACGACTVIVDTVPVLACMLLAVEQVGKNIETIEGLQKGNTLHPIQESWLEEYGAQCGFCSPGMIMSTKGFLDTHPKAAVTEIKEAMGGNICICGNYEHILNAIVNGQNKMLGKGEHGHE